MTDETELMKLLKDHTKDFRQFREEDWKEHCQESRETRKLAESNQTTLQAMLPNMAHLANLPLMAQSLVSIDKGHNLQVQSLINQNGMAGKNNSKIIHSVLLICMVFVIVVGIALIGVVLRATDKSLEVTRDGLRLSSPPIEAPRGDNKKTPESVQ